MEICMKSDVERAIEIIGRKTSIPADGETFEDVEKAFDIALAALREKQERENPKPLTLDDLREMERTGTPVWLVPKTETPTWAFVSDIHNDELIYFDCADNCEYEFDLCSDAENDQFVAYRTKPLTGGAE